MEISRAKVTGIIRSKKDGTYGLITDVYQEENNISVIMQGSDTEKYVAASTLKRWYDEVTETDPSYAAVRAEFNKLQEYEPAAENTALIQAEEVSNVVTPTPTETADDFGDKHEIEETKADGTDAVAQEVIEPTTGEAPPTLKLPKKVMPHVLALMGELERFAQDLGADVTLKETGNYRGIYVNKSNICELHPQMKKLRMHVNGKSLSDELLAKCKRMPETFGWVLDAVCYVETEADMETAKAIIVAGREYRL